MKTIISILLLFFMYSAIIFAQDNAKSNIFPNGITAAYGLGNYSVKDEFISKEKYSGNLPYYSVGWFKKHNNYVYQLQFNYRNSENIKNNNVLTHITQFSLNQGFLYPLKEKNLLSKNLFLWIGPSTEFFFYVSEPQVANYGISTANLFSVGLNVYAIYPLNQKLNIESSLEFTAIALGSRTDEPEQTFKLVTLFSDLNSSINFGARYYLFNQLSVSLSYRFEISRFNSWDYYIAASDNVVFRLTYSFKEK